MSMSRMGVWLRPQVGRARGRHGDFHFLPSSRIIPSDKAPCLPTFSATGRVGDRVLLTGSSARRTSLPIALTNTLYHMGGLRAHLRWLSCNRGGSPILDIKPSDGRTDIAPSSGAYHNPREAKRFGSVTERLVGILQSFLKYGHLISASEISWVYVPCVEACTSGQAARIQPRPLKNQPSSPPPTPCLVLKYSGGCPRRR